MPVEPQALEIGKGRIVREGKKVAILSLGTRLAEAEKAADELEAKGLSTTVADLRFAKPLDSELIRKLLTTPRGRGHGRGSGDRRPRRARADARQRRGAGRRRPQDPHHAPARRFQEHDKPEKQYDEARLNAPHIVETVLKALRVNSAGVEEVRA